MERRGHTAANVHVRNEACGWGSGKTVKKKGMGTQNRVTYGPETWGGKRRVQDTREEMGRWGDVGNQMGRWM